MFKIIEETVNVNDGYFTPTNDVIQDFVRVFPNSFLMGFYLTPCNRTDGKYTLPFHYDGTIRIKYVMEEREKAPSLEYVMNLLK